MNKHDKLDVLINNAGILTSGLIRNEDGLELQLAGHRVSPANLEDLNFEKSDYNPLIAYASSKTAVLWFSNF